MKTPDYCEGCNQRFAPIDQQSCWGCKEGDCNTSKRGLLNATMKKKIEQLDGGVIALCETYSQVNKALCGKENATPSELLQAVSQLKDCLAQVERERDAAVKDLSVAKSCKICKNNAGVFVQNICMDCIECCNFEWRGVCEENTEEAMTGWTK